jgi:GMP synthase-like glutamine amidotransferase
MPRRRQRAVAGHVSLPTITMKPIAVFQHTEVGAPGNIIPIVEALGRRCEIISIVDGAPVPSRPDRYGGLIFMGGYMSVHDPYPWIAKEISLIRQADALDIPVAGHCLGSQLLAVALGGEVRQNFRREIGWQRISVEGGSYAQEWWGKPDAESLLTFQWHGDTFELPAGAARIASSMHCRNQAFVARDLHLGVQSHLEMTPDLVRVSLERNGAQLINEYNAGNPAVTSMAETGRELAERTAETRASLARLYSRWIQRCA